jgi:hypothetical protein
LLGQAILHRLARRIYIAQRSHERPQHTEEVNHGSCKEEGTGKEGVEEEGQEVVARWAA